MLINDEEYQEGYEGIWEDFKTNILSPIWQAIKPSAPEITYRLVAPYVPKLPEEVAPPVVTKPAIPSWILPVGIGVGALILIAILRKRKA